jgi:hypothetical protein
MTAVGSQDRLWPVEIVVRFHDGAVRITGRDTWDGAAGYLLSAPFTAIRDHVAAVTITSDQQGRRAQ